MKKLISVNLSTAKFACANFNRDINPKRLYESIKLHKRVIVPIIAMNASEPVYNNAKLTDIEDGHTLSKDEYSNYFVVIDGQHRVKTSFLINKEAEESTEENPLRIDEIDINLFDAAELHGESASKLISSINETSANWKPKDYCKQAYVMNPDDDKIKSIYLLVNELNVPFSTVSRYLTFNSNGLHPQGSTRYVHGENSALNDVNYKRGIMLYKILLEIGFSSKYIAKRYMIEEIIRAHRKSAKDCEKLISLLWALKDCGKAEVIKEIEKLKHDDATTSGKITKILEKSVNPVKDGFVFDIENEDNDLFEGNVKFLKDKLKEQHEAKLEKKRTKSKKSKDKKKCNNVSDAPNGVMDIK